MKRKSVLCFADYGAPYTGNFIASLAGLEKELSARGRNMVYLFSGVSAKAPWIEKFSREHNVYILSGGFFTNLTFVRSIIKKHNIGIIHTHFTTTRFNLILNLARSFLGKSVYIRHVRGKYKRAGSIPAELLKRIICESSMEIASSPGVYDQLIAGGYNPKHVTMILNSIDFSRLNNTPAAKRNELGLTEDGLAVMMFGYNVKIKGVDLAVKAINALREDGLDIKLFVIAAANHDEVCAELATYTDGKLPDWISIVGPREDVAAYYNAADIFLSASRHEGFCNALIEAAFCETLTVESDIPGHYLKTSDMLLFESENIASLTEALRTAAKPCDRSEMLQRQKQYVVNKFDISKWATAVADVYEPFFQKIDK